MATQWTAGTASGQILTAAKLNTIGRFVAFAGTKPLGNETDTLPPMPPPVQVSNT